VNLNTLDDAFERRAFEDELDTVWESPDGTSNDTLSAYESYVKESNSDKTPTASRGIFVRRISQSSFRVSLIFGDRSKSLSVLKSGQRTIYSSPIPGLNEWHGVASTPWHITSSPSNT
jgi:phage-related protein